MIDSSALYTGHVMHQRLRPRRHRLNYRLFMLLLDIDAVTVLTKRLRFFSHNRFNLFSFHNRDHGAGKAEQLREYVETHMSAAGIATPCGAIHLLTMPRVLGFVFNPLSVYFCYHAEGPLAAILYEVSNTFGQRHSYLMPVNEASDGLIRQTTAKNFHVSPFMPMQMNYDFRVRPPAERLSLGITGSDDQGVLITAILAGHRKPLTDAVLLRVFISFPLMTFKVVGGILWEALKLWLKRIPLHPNPPEPATSVTYVSHGKRS